jgi:uncharacterized protein YjbI with pentapeptide repeats
MLLQSGWLCSFPCGLLLCSQLCKLHVECKGSRLQSSLLPCCNWLSCLLLGCLLLGCL